MASLNLEPPRRKTVVESIIEQIIARLRDGTLNPGDRLPSERKLIEMLGVSRSSVREALQGLAAMDLVESRPGEGTFVRQIKAQFDIHLEIEDLSDALQKEMRLHVNQARLLLEQQIVTLAAEEVTDADRQTLSDACREYDAAVQRSLETLQPFWAAHNQIHLSIAQTTGNPILVQILQSLLDLVPSSLRDKGFLDGSRPVAEELAERERTIHRGLCQAVARGDAVAAHDWLLRHAEAEEAIIARYYAETVAPETPG